MGFRNPISFLSDLVADSITGAVITGGQIIGTVITGSTLRTAETGERIEITTTSQNLIRFITGLVGGADGSIAVDALEDSYAHLSLTSPRVPGGAASVPKLVLESATAGQGGNGIYFKNAPARFRYNQGTGGLEGVDFGVFTGTVDGNGDVTVAHGLLTTPAAVVATSRQSGAARQQAVITLGATTFTVRTRGADGNVIASGATTSFYWAALA